MHYLLKTKFGFPDTEVLMLRDDSIGWRDQRLMPTRGNIRAAMQWLMKGAKAGDRLFFHFSGRQFESLYLLTITARVSRMKQGCPL
jgi:hypothetical protein